MPFSNGYGVSTYTGVFSGTNYISSNYSYNWSTGGNFTMEAWIYPTAFSSTINMVGGFVVTDRMLEMFKPKKTPPASDKTGEVK